MKRAFVIAALSLWMACWGSTAAKAEQKNAAALEKEYQKETNPRKRADIARQMMNQRLEQLRARVATGLILEPTAPEIANYQAALDRLASSVRAARHNGTSKSAETHLRTHLHELDEIKLNVSVGERPALDQLVARLSALREEVLYSLMHPTEDSKGKESAQK